MNPVPGCNINTVLTEGNIPENDPEPYAADGVWCYFRVGIQTQKRRVGGQGITEGRTQAM